MLNSIVYPGDIGPLTRVLMRAKAGLPITIAGIGGSITAGYVSSETNKRWLNLVASALGSQFGAQVNVWDAGIAGTNSDYGALRIDRDVISRNVDLVFVEYAVNDTEAQFSSYDSLLRRLITSRRPPAIIALMMSNCLMQSKQDGLIPIAQTYNLPIISYPNAATAAIAAGTATAAQFMSPDGVHPPDFGHAFAAQCIQPLIDLAAFQIVAPLYPNIFDKTNLISNSELASATMTGFVYSPDPGDDPIENVGALISNAVWQSFSIPVNVGSYGRIWLLAGVQTGVGYGTVYCTIDGNPASVLDFNCGTANPGQQLFIAAGAISPGVHTLTVQNWPSASKSSGAFVWIAGIGSA